uniref:Uncharacterized protein n=1 Tax=Fagus sylvatica TaxID=28930 RepID=A0A2N9E5P8_FAGSY
MGFDFMGLLVWVCGGLGLWVWVCQHGFVVDQWWLCAVCGGFEGMVVVGGGSVQCVVVCGVGLQAKQRADEIQGLKMRLRFREAAIKRLEAVASGKILAETHLPKEKEEHLKEIEVLRVQVDRNQEVTRFAMENL